MEGHCLYRVISYVETIAKELHSPIHYLVILDFPFVPLVKHISHRLLISLPPVSTSNGISLSIAVTTDSSILFLRLLSSNSVQRKCFTIVNWLHSV